MLYSRICLIRHLKMITKKWRVRRSDELYKQVKILSLQLVYFIIIDRIHSDFVCSKSDSFAYLDILFDIAVLYFLCNFASGNKPEKNCRKRYSQLKL